MKAVSVIVFVSAVTQSSVVCADSLMNPESSVICPSTVLAKCLVLVKGLVFVIWLMTGMEQDWCCCRATCCGLLLPLCLDRSGQHTPDSLGSLTPAPTSCRLSVVELLLRLQIESIALSHGLLDAGVMSLCGPVPISVPLCRLSYFQYIFASPPRLCGSFANPPVSTRTSAWVSKNS